jgi:hypothetical protein
MYGRWRTTGGAPVVILQGHPPVTQGEENFSLSPDGRWIVFISRINSTKGPDFAVLDLQTRRVEEVRVHEPTRLYDPLFHVGVWAADGKTAFIRGTFGAVFALVPGARRMTLVDSAAVPARDVPPLVFHQLSPREVAVFHSGEPSAPIARHHVNTVWRTRIGATYPSISADGRFAAYVVTEAWGTFAGVSRAYVVRLDSRPPKSLEVGKGVIGPLRLDGQHQLAYGIQQSNGQLAIVRWRIP